MKKLVSVIIPIYNVEMYLRRCIESVLNQSYENLEIILVNDGSTDGSKDICYEYLSSDNRIKLVDKPNGGLSSARNSGIDIANGDYLVFVDSDDWVEQDYVSTFIEYADENTVCCCGYNMIFNECIIPNRIKKRTRFKVLDFIDMMLNMELDISNGKKNNPIGNYIWNKMWPKHCFENVRFPNYKFEDMYCFMDLILLANSVVVVPDCNYNYLQRGNSIVHTANYEDVLRARLRQETILSKYTRFYEKTSTLTAAAAVMSVKHSDIRKKNLTYCQNIVRERIMCCSFSNYKILFKEVLFLICPKVLCFIYKFK